MPKISDFTLVIPCLRRRSCKGFTLVELLVVIAIIAVLSVIGVTLFSSIQKGARDARRRGDLEAISTALEIYHTQTGSYPVGRYMSNNGDGSGNFNVADAWRYDTGGGGVEWGLRDVLVGGNFIQSLPLDPINKTGGAGNYLGDGPSVDLAYVYNSDGVTYFIATNLETQAAAADVWGNYKVRNKQ